jgi:hypothetical protein
MTMKIMTTRFAARFALGLGVLAFPLLNGCTPWATYPPIQGAAGFNDPYLDPIPFLMAESISSVYERDGGEGVLLFNLPEGTPPQIYEIVARKLGTGEPLRRAGDPAYHVLQVRVRSMDAEVDVVHRGVQGFPELVTVHFYVQAPQGYRVTNMRVWRFQQEEPTPNWFPPDERNAHAEAPVS